MLDTSEVVGAVMAGTAPQADVDTIERACLPTIGACAGQFTANTMAMVSETLGLAPIGSAMLPAVHVARAPLATPRRRSGVLEKYAAVVGPAHLGAVTHRGPREASRSDV